MIVTINLALGDYMESHRVDGLRGVVVRNHQRKLYLIVLALAFSGMLISLPGLIYLGLKVYSWFLILAFFVGLYAVIVVKSLIDNLSGKTIRRIYHANEANADTHHAEVTANGFTYCTPQWTSEIEWRAAIRIVEAESILIVIDDTPRKLIVPKRAFASEAELYAFKTALAQGIAGSKL